MIGRRRHEQSSGPGSANYQAGRDIVQTGLSASEAREIALDVYKSNFLVLSGIAEQVAADRAERLTREFLNRLERHNARLLSRMQDPDMLSVMYTAQAGIARSGEPDLETALVDLLVDRAEQEERDLKTLVLNEAIEILPKLTTVQRCALTVCFLFRYTGYRGSFSLADFYTNMDLWKPAFDIASIKRADLQYLQAARVGSLSISSAPLGMILAENALGFFTRGFAAEDVPEVLRGFIGDTGVFIPCLRDAEKLQINAISRQDVRELEASYAMSANVLQNFSQVGGMNQPDILADLVEHIPEVATVEERWDKAGLTNFELTAAGLAIGHAYWKQIVPIGAAGPLDLWLTE